MKISVLTLFPEMFETVFGDSIVGKARDKQLVSIDTVNFRDFAEDKHRTVDDYPYGGGGGMLLKPGPLFAAAEHVAERCQYAPRVILMCPQGERYSQAKAEELAQERELVFVCGHYEGVDERIREHLVTDELSVGDFVLTGGEIPAMAVIDSVVRLLPGVLGNECGAEIDSFSSGLLEYPQYTRPASFRGWSVPDVLISGNHGKIAEWRRKEALYRTWKKRPDLLKYASLSEQDHAWLQSFENGHDVD